MVRNSFIIWSHLSGSSRWEWQIVLKRENPTVHLHHVTSQKGQSLEKIPQCSTEEVATLWILLCIANIWNDLKSLATLLQESQISWHYWCNSPGSYSSAAGYSVLQCNTVSLGEQISTSPGIEDPQIWHGVRWWVEEHQFMDIPVLATDSYNCKDLHITAYHYTSHTELFPASYAILSLEASVGTSGLLRTKVSSCLWIILKWPDYGLGSFAQPHPLPLALALLRLYQRCYSAEIHCFSRHTRSLTSAVLMCWDQQPEYSTTQANPATDMLWPLSCTSAHKSRLPLLMHSIPVLTLQPLTMWPLPEELNILMPSTSLLSLFWHIVAFLQLVELWYITDTFISVAPCRLSTARR